jgi:hypothetical protein
MRIAIAGSEAQPPFGDPPSELLFFFAIVAILSPTRPVHHREHHPLCHPPQRQIDLNCNALLGEPCTQVQVYSPKAAGRWSSSAYKLYIDLTQEERIKMSRQFQRA